MNQITLDTVDHVSVTTIIDNATDALLPDQGVARRGGFGALVATRFAEQGGSIDPFRAEHGFSALIEIERNGTRHQLLFDTGLSTDGAVENMRRLEVKLADIEAIILSHGHFDHTMGMHGIAESLGRRNLPVFIHPEAWQRRRVVFEGRDPMVLPTPSKSAYEGAGFEVIEQRQPSFLFDRSLLVTGEVDRTTEFELGMPRHQAERDGDWVADPLIMDDQAVVMHVSGKGLLVITGCGHAGIVNIVRHAQALTGVDEIYAVIGGFHLQGADLESVVQPTIHALRESGPSILVPAHCTGRVASVELESAFPDAFIQNSVGTRFDL